MVLTKKFSEFVSVTPSTINDANEKLVGLENGANMQSTRFFTWTTAGRPPTPFNGLLGFNTTLQQYEFWDAVLSQWTQLEDSGDINNLIARLAAHTPGDGASMIGLLNQSNVTNKTVQDLADATFIAQTDNGTLQNAQFLGSLTTGIVKNTTVTGVLSISAPLTSIDGLTTVANNLLYTTGPDVYSVIAPANDAALITSAAGVPSLSQTLPTAVQSNITQLGAQSQALNMNTHLINNVVDPVSAQDAATKNYVDQTALTGTSVYAATTVNLSATQAGAGVGATLTDNSGTFAVFTLDGVNPPLGSNVLVKDYATAANEGIYTLTTQGDGISIPWQLTRSTSYNTPDEINNTGLIIIQNGTQAGQAWYNTATIVTVDTTAFNFVQFGSGGTITSISAADATITLTPDPITTTGTIAVNTATFIRTIKTQTFTTNGTYTPSAGMLFCTVEIVGAGGGSGGTAAGGSQSAASAGGGGAGYCKRTYSAALLGANAAVVVPSTGGAAGASGNNAGGTGSNSTFTPAGAGTVLTAAGGVGGAGGAGTGTVAVSGNAGVGGTATGGEVNIPGGPGSIGFVLLGTAGQGIGGAGGASVFSNTNFNPADPSTAGTSGANYGGGASGAINATAANAAGAVGGAGLCIITEYCNQ